MDTLIELVDLLSPFANIDAAAIDGTDHLYAGYDDDLGDINAWVADADTNVTFYRLRVRFVEGDVTYVISPNAIEENGTFTDHDS